MNFSTHYALLVGINRYPGLSDLNGPENDALAFKDWLLDSAGGGLSSDHVVLIKSSDFPPVADPYDADPTESRVKQSLNKLLKRGGEWRERVGERLYLYFAGHGFTAGSLSDPALFTAQAQFDDRGQYIAGLRYASKIANAGFFDEIVLVMDCCQDVLRTTAVVDPSWTPPDRQASSRVKMMQAFGAPRGQKAFETSADGRDGPSRGFFSRSFLEALREAPADAQGWVHARDVGDHFTRLWNEQHPDLAEFVPPVHAPRGMPLYQRRVSTTAIAHEMSIEVVSPYESARHSTKGIDVGQLPLKTMRLEREVDASRGDEMPVSFTLRPVRLTSPVPVTWSRSYRELQAESALQLLERSASEHRPDGKATLLVFARDSASLSGPIWRMQEPLRGGLRLRRYDATARRVVRDIPVEVKVDDERATATIVERLEPGSYLLGVRRRLRTQWVWDEQVLHLAPGWRTEVWLDAIDDGHTGSRFDLESASLLITRGDAEHALRDERVCLTESLRGTLLQTGRESMSIRSIHWPARHEEAGPMALLFTAALGLQTLPSDVKAVRAATRWLEEHWSASSADVFALQRWCDRIEGTVGPTSGPDELPMLMACWDLLMDRGGSPPLSMAAQRAVGWWRVPAVPWVQMQRPEDELPAIAPRGLMGTLSSAPVGGALRLFPGLRRPLAGISPVQQMLRALIVEAVDDGDSEPLDGLVARVAGNTNLANSSVAQALDELLSLLAQRR